MGSENSKLLEESGSGTIEQFIDRYKDSSLVELTEIAYQLSLDEDNELLDSKNKIDGFRWLIANGADLNANNGAVLFYLTQYNEFLDLITPIANTINFNISNSKDESLFATLINSENNTNKNEAIQLFLLHGMNVKQMNKDVLLNVYHHDSPPYFSGFTIVIEWLVINGNVNLLKESLFHLAEKVTHRKAPNFYSAPFIMPGLNSDDAQYIKEKLRTIFNVENEIELLTNLSFLTLKISRVSSFDAVLKEDNNYQLFFSWSSLNEMVKKGFLHEEVKNLIVSINAHCADDTIPANCLVLQRTMQEQENSRQKIANFGMGIFNAHKLKDIDISVSQSYTM